MVAFLSKNRYLNPHIRNARRGLFDFLLWRVGFYKDKASIKTPPADFSYPNPLEVIHEEKPQLTWINHSTFLVHVDGLNILTDPIWEKRCSPLKHIGPKRQHNPPLSISELPPIDLVLISHNHYDHLDEKSVKQLHRKNPQTVWIVPKGLRSWFYKRGIRSVVELSWWEERELSLGSQRPLRLQITSVPSQHFSGRGLFDKNKTLWTGWVVRFQKEEEKLRTLYFVGDTGYNDKDFAEIGRVFGGFDLSLIPIGTYVPHAFMDPVHIDPYKAVAIHKEVRSHLSVGMHWRTFRLSEEGLDQPPYDLFCALQEAGEDPNRFRVINPGQTINW